MREKIILVTLDDVGRVGAATFNVKLVCDALDVSYSLINHHFGSRDELIAEAAVLWYSLYIDALWKAANNAPSRPDDRLRAWLTENVSWSRRYNGMSAILDYPTASGEVTRVIDEKYREDFTQLAELNIGRLFSLVLDVRNGEVGLYQLSRGNVQREGLATDPHIMELTGSIAWSILGMSVWNAGQHLPTTQIEGVSEMHARLSNFHIEHLIDFAKNG